MINLARYIQDFSTIFPTPHHQHPWDIVTAVQSLLSEKIKALSGDYRIKNDVAIHKDARIEEHVILKGPVIVSAGCFIGAHAYLRGGVFIGEHTVIGPGCEVKSTLIMPHSALAHFNFAGDSLIGSYVNMEAGSVIANHYNEREDKTIYCLIGGKKTAINVTKFGALIGDHTRIGANAVLSPGTILTPESVVKRLQLVEQNP